MSAQVKMKFGKLSYSFSSHIHAIVKGPAEQMKSAGG